MYNFFDFEHVCDNNILIKIHSLKKTKIINNQNNITSNNIQQCIEDCISPQKTHYKFVSAINLDNSTSSESLKKH